VVAGFAVASLLNLNIRLRSLFRTIYYLPSVVPAAASALIWAWIFHAQYGLLNTVLRAIGLPGPMWLADRALVKPALVLVSWWATGSTMVIFLAALQDVPRELYDAAKIDGAGWWSEMRYITISMVTPAILFTLLTGLIGAFSYFTLPYIMTRGGPAGASTFVPQYLYQNAFFWFKMGYASSQAWFMFAITIVVAVLVFKTSARWVFYAGAEK
jgi:multiple sugar transport system permease protein